MSQTLAELTDSLQALLLDDGTMFPDDTCEAAIRQTLNKFNFAVPQVAAEEQDAVSDQYDYELEDGTALAVLDVLLEGTDPAEQYNVSLPFDVYFEDDRPFIRLRTPIGDGSEIIIRYVKPYTIDGLDGEGDSTLPPVFDPVLLDGAAWIVCLIRAAGRVETINMNQGVIANYEKMAAHFQQAFEAGLNQLRRRRPPVSEPQLSGWDDDWAGQW